MFWLKTILNWKNALLLDKIKSQFILLHLLERGVQKKRLFKIPFVSCFCSFETEKKEKHNTKMKI